MKTVFFWFTLLAAIRILTFEAVPPGQDLALEKGDGVYAVKGDGTPIPTAR